MDFGLKGKWGLVCAGSKGLGRACAESLAEEGVNIIIVARGAEALAETAEHIRSRTTVEVKTVVADITTQEGRELTMNACPQLDILVNNAGGPPAGDFRSFTLTVLDGMIDRKFGRIVNITSAAVKAPIPILGLSNGARAGLTGFIAGLSRQTPMHNVTINNILPGAFATETMNGRMAAMAKQSNTTIEEVAQSRLNAIPAGRFGQPKEFGQLCAYICSAQASYITGHNFLIDGGVYNGTL